MAGRASRLTWNIRDVPYGWDYFMENVMDPAHVAVSHHGITGNRYTSPQYYDMVPVRQPGPDGFSFEVVQDPVPGVDITRSISDFRAPSLHQISAEWKGGGKLILALYATPTVPGYCRHIGCQVLVKGDNGKLPPGIGLFALPMPVWLNHALTSLFLHQDQVFLHHQEKILARRGYSSAAEAVGSKYIEEVFTPNPQDRMVITFRRWLRRTAAGGVPWAPGSPPLPPREHRKEVLFDVYNSHTKNCKNCMDALRNIERLRAASLAGAVLVAASSHGLVPAVIAAALLAVGGVSHALAGLFYRYEFEHAYND